MRRTNKSAGGVGESRPFVAPPGAFDPMPDFLVGGEPVSGRPMPHAIPSHYSDDSIAERAARPHAATRTIRDHFDKQVDKRADFRAKEDEPWEAPNAMKEFADEHCPAGHVPRFLGDAKVKRDGLRRWQPVIGANGDPLRHGDMTLASMPVEMAAKRNKFFRDMDRDRISKIEAESNGQASRSAREQGMRAAPGEVGFVRSKSAALDE